MATEWQPSNQQITRPQTIRSWRTHYIFFPVAVKTADSWYQQTMELVREIGRRTAATEDSREPTFLFQTLSVALRRGNLVSFLGIYPLDYSLVAVIYIFC